MILIKKGYYKYVCNDSFLLFLWMADDELVRSLMTPPNLTAAGPFEPVPAAAGIARPYPSGDTAWHG